MFCPEASKYLQLPDLPSLQSLPGLLTESYSLRKNLI